MNLKKPKYEAEFVCIVGDTDTSFLAWSGLLLKFYVCSTNFEFGFGAEIGISTHKLHARGPMGLKELTTSKYIIYGNGQIRE